MASPYGIFTYVNSDPEKLQFLSANLRRRRFLSEVFETGIAVADGIHRPGNAGRNERDALSADIFLSSANAVSLDGQIVNIDGTGNRVAATCFGPRHVIFVVGMNKITETLEGAMARAKEAAVKLAIHYRRKTPCVKTGICTDCLSAECICSVMAIHRKNPLGNKVSVFLVAENLGL